MGKSELITYLRASSFKRGFPDTRFIILHHSRTGSTLLADLLNSHPDVLCDSEILTEKKTFPYLFIQAKARSCPKKAYGLKVKSHHLFDVQRVKADYFLYYLIQKKWKVVSLWRENIFLQVLSLYISEMRNIYVHQASKGPAQLPKFTIPPTDIIERMHQKSEAIAYQKELVEDFPHLELTYEKDLLSSVDHQKTADRVFDYLGLPHSPVKTDLLKIVPSKWSDIVENHEELARAVKNSPFAQFLPG